MMVSLRIPVHYTLVTILLGILWEPVIPLLDQEVEDFGSVDEVNSY